ISTTNQLAYPICIAMENELGVKFRDIMEPIMKDINVLFSRQLGSLLTTDSSDDTTTSNTILGPRLRGTSSITSKKPPTSSSPLFGLHSSYSPRASSHKTSSSLWSEVEDEDVESFLDDDSTSEDASSTTASLADGL